MGWCGVGNPESRGRANVNRKVVTENNVTAVKGGMRRRTQFRGGPSQPLVEKKTC